MAHLNFLENVDIHPLL